MKKYIILDTCIVINMLSVINKDNFDEINPEMKNNSFAKLFMLAKKGEVQFLATPKIYDELTVPHFFNPQKTTSRLNHFIKNYLKLIEFNAEQLVQVENLRSRFADEKIKVYTNHKSHDETVFKLASTPGMRNFADCLIYAEAVMANYPMITANLKDFRNTTYAVDILKRINSTKRSKVYSIEESLEYLNTPQEKNSNFTTSDVKIKEITF